MPPSCSYPSIVQKKTPAPFSSPAYTSLYLLQCLAVPRVGLFRRLLSLTRWSRRPLYASLYVRLLSLAIAYSNRRRCFASLTLWRLTRLRVSAFSIRMRWRLAFLDPSIRQLTFHWALVDFVTLGIDDACAGLVACLERDFPGKRGDLLIVENVTVFVAVFDFLFARDDRAVGSWWWLGGYVCVTNWADGFLLAMLDEGGVRSSGGRDRNLRDDMLSGVLVVLGAN